MLYIYRRKHYTHPYRLTVTSKRLYIPNHV